MEAFFYSDQTGAGPIHHPLKDTFPNLLSQQDSIPTGKYSYDLIRAYPQECADFLTNKIIFMLKKGQMIWSGIDNISEEPVPGYYWKNENYRDVKRIYFEKPEMEQVARQLLDLPEFEGGLEWDGELLILHGPEFDLLSKPTDLPGHNSLITAYAFIPELFMPDYEWIDWSRVQIGNLYSKKDLLNALLTVAEEALTAGLNGERQIDGKSLVQYVWDYLRRKPHY